jgi:hypothetical protein
MSQLHWLIVLGKGNIDLDRGKYICIYLTLLAAGSDICAMVLKPFNVAYKQVLSYESTMLEPVFSLYFQ